MSVENERNFASIQGATIFRFNAGMYSRKKQESCIKWFINKKLSLHLYKTECILLRPNRKLKTLTDVKINCNGQRSIKY